MILLNGRKPAASAVTARRSPLAYARGCVDLAPNVSEGNLSPGHRPSRFKDTGPVHPHHLRTAEIRASLRHPLHLPFGHPGALTRGRKAEKMKTKLLAMAVLAGGSMFAQPGYSNDPRAGGPGYGGPDAGYNQSPSYGAVAPGPGPGGGYEAAIPPSPGPGYVWIPGYWSQNYAQSVWVPGYWAIQTASSGYYGGYGPGYYAPGYYGAGYYGGIYFGGGYFRGGYFRGSSARGGERFAGGFNSRGAVNRGVQQGRTFSGQGQAFSGQNRGSTQFQQRSAGRVQSQPQSRANSGGNRSSGQQSRQGGSSSGRSRGR